MASAAVIWCGSPGSHAPRGSPRYAPRGSPVAPSRALVVGILARPAGAVFAPAPTEVLARRAEPAFPRGAWERGETADHAAGHHVDRSGQVRAALEAGVAGVRGGDLVRLPGSHAPRGSPVAASRVLVVGIVARPAGAVFGPAPTEVLARRAEPAFPRGAWE